MERKNYLYKITTEEIHLWKEPGGNPGRGVGNDKSLRWASTQVSSVEI